MHENVGVVLVLDIFTRNKRFNLIKSRLLHYAVWFTNYNKLKLFGSKLAKMK